MDFLERTCVKVRSEVIMENIINYDIFNLTYRSFCLEPVYWKLIFTVMSETLLRLFNVQGIHYPPAFLDDF